MRTKTTPYFSITFLSRWCIAVGVALAALVLFISVYRTSISEKLSTSYGSVWSDSQQKQRDSKLSDLLLPGDTDEKKPKSTDDSEIPSPVEGKPEKIQADRPISIESFAESSCPKWFDDRINVHFILHTHDDPGWLKTPDQYYYDDVYHIFNAFIKELIMEPQRKFVYSELYYFNKWWATLKAPMRDIVTKMIKNGQLEFVGGGWVQNDDASTHYTAMMDQLTYGWLKIDDYFGEAALPKTGWQIDCFGYSQEQAAVFDQMGLDEEVIVRLHHNDIKRRREEKEMEFLWRTSPHSQLFTHVLYDHYTAPSGFQFELPPNDDITAHNQEEKASRFLDTVRERSQAYRTNHLLLIMGHDFVYKEAHIWFNAIDRLIRGGNLKQLNGSDIQLFYSTPSCYFKAVREAARNRNLTWPSYNGDFFPYATSPGHYWTGYFSSRSNLKRVIRMANNLLLTAQNLAASISDSSVNLHLNLSREALYTTLHHDGITGTCKQAVADEYLRYALRSIDYSHKVINAILPKLAGRKEEAVFDFCLLSNVSLCPISQKSDEVSMVVLNGFSHDRLSFIRIPVDSKATYELQDFESKPVPYQIFPVTDEVRQFPKIRGRSSAELGFFADLPALGFAGFRLKQRRQNGQSDDDAGNDQDTTIRVKRVGKTEFEPPAIENEFYKLELDRNGRVAFITDKKNKGDRQRLAQDFFWYTNPDSGAYMMRPVKTMTVSNDSVKVERIEKGPLVQELRQTFASWVTQIIRLYKGKPYVEFEWSVGPLEPEHVGKEVITRFYTDLKTDGVFYTDANGRRLVQRKRNPEDSYHPIAASYFPITAAAVIKDQHHQLSLIPDRAVGASSVLDGSLELMPYRKVLYDDGAGMGEGLNERDETNRAIVTRGKIWLTFTPVEKADSEWRRLAKEMFYEPVVGFSQKALPKWPNKISMLRQQLPDPIHLLTLQRLSNYTCLIRFEHFLYEESSDAAVPLQFQERFRGLDLEKCTKTQLGGWSRTKAGTPGVTAQIRPTEISTYKCRCRSTMIFDRSLLGQA